MERLNQKDREEIIGKIKRLDPKEVYDFDKMTDEDILSKYQVLCFSSGKALHDLEKLQEDDHKEL